MRTAWITGLMLVVLLALAFVLAAGCTKSADVPPDAGLTATPPPDDTGPADEEGDEDEATDAEDEDAEPAEGEPTEGDTAEAGDEADSDGWVTTDTGLEYMDLAVGDGPSPKQGDRVVVHYTGRLKDGTKFDSSVDRDEPFSFAIGLGEVIEGWDEGVMTMKVGGKRKLVIPSELGYGSAGTPGGPIPPDAELHFEVELLEIE